MKTTDVNATAAKNILNRVKEMVQACIQCGTCTASCPNAFAMDHPPPHALADGAGR